MTNVAYTGDEDGYSDKAHLSMDLIVHDEDEQHSKRIGFHVIEEQK